MAKTKLVIFDVDGLMLNTEFLWERAHEIVAEQTGVPEIGKEFFHKSVGLTGSDFTRVLDEHMPHVENRYELLEKAKEAGLQLLEDRLDVMPGLLNLLAYLDKNGYQKAVATTTFHEMTFERLSRMNLKDRFDWILCGDEVKKRKPDPEIYQTVIDHFAIDPKEALVLEDSVYGVEAAYRAGIPCIMIPSIVQPSDKQRKEALCILDSLHDVREYLIRNC